MLLQFAENFSSTHSTNGSISNTKQLHNFLFLNLIPNMWHFKKRVNTFNTTCSAFPADSLMNCPPESGLAVYLQWLCNEILSNQHSYNKQHYTVAVGRVYGNLFQEESSIICIKVVATQSVFSLPTLWRTDWNDLLSFFDYWINNLCYLKVRTSYR